MFKPVQFPEPVESMVRFVEETDPSEIIEATLEKLRGGTPAIDLLRAAGLAVVRSTDLPPNHHGGPVHPVSGIVGTYNIYRRLEGESAYVPIVQHVTLCNNHVHSAQMGPYIMPEMEPLESHGEKIGSYHMGESVDLGFRSTARDGDAIGLTEEAFHKSLQARSPSIAQQYYIWLLNNVSQGQALDIILPSAISRNAMDDHYFVYPVFTFRTLDLVGWEWAPYFLRPVVRFLARHPYSIDVERPMPFSEMEELVDKYGLDDRNLPVATSSRETEMIGALADQIGRSDNYYDTPEMIAQALSEGMSLEGAGEALAYGGSKAFLRTIYGNPMDAHIHTGSTNRRYLLGQEDVSQRNKVLALMSGITGPECVLGMKLLDEEVENASDRIPNPTQESLLEAVAESIESLPHSDWSNPNFGSMTAPREIVRTIGLARQYAEKRYDPLAFFNRMAELICRDDFTELHSIKHNQALFEEFYATREPYRWEHLVAAAKSAAIIYTGREQSIYDRTKVLLNV